LEGENNAGGREATEVKPSSDDTELRVSGGGEGVALGHRVKR